MSEQTVIEMGGAEIAKRIFESGAAQDAPDMGLVSILVGLRGGAIFALDD